jgi:DNA modification methylase
MCPGLNPAHIVDCLFTGHAATVMKGFPSGCIDLIITSPPYWTAVEYDHGENLWPSYEAYLDDMQSVWNECARVLRANGKLCINAPIMPIPKNVIQQHTRHLKNIAFDMERRILQKNGIRAVHTLRLAKTNIEDDVRELPVSRKHLRE